MIVIQKELETMSGYKRKYDLEMWLKKNGIGYTVGRDGIIGTTIAAINEATVKKSHEATNVTFHPEQSRNEYNSTNTLEELSNEYQDSQAFSERATSTQKLYHGFHRRIMTCPISDGTPFGQTLISDISRGTIRNYLDRRPINASKREKSYLSLVFRWAYQRDFVDFNPITELS